MVVETQIKVFALRITGMAQMKRLEPRIRRMTQMALIFRYGQQVGMPGHVSSVKSFNPCKSVIQTMGVVWN
jgi:hypothetical protein